MSTTSAYPERPIPLFVVEDQLHFLKNLLKVLGTFENIEVVGTATSGEVALKELPASEARVALVDIELPGITGLELVGRLKQAQVDCELLMLTSFAHDDKVFEAMRLGACGYLLKGVAPDRLLAAIEAADEGGTVIEPRLASRFWRYFKGVEAPPRPSDLLDDDELELLELIAKGLSNSESASVLGVGTRNVRTRLGKIYDKLGVRSHVEAVVEAMKRGLLSI